MKVGLVTPWIERCGITEYSKELIELSEGKYEFEVINEKSSLGVIRDQIQNCDLVHVNGSGFLVSKIDYDFVKSFGKKTILTLYESGKNNEKNQLVSAFDYVVTHEKEGLDIENFIHIPHPIYTVPLNHTLIPDSRIGTVGFPFEWKGFDLVAQVANELSFDFIGFIPNYNKKNTSNRYKTIIEAINPNFEVVTDYKSKKEILDALNTCRINSFLYHGNRVGVSGACRFGLAARRPMVVTRDRQFNDLFEYEDEIWFADSLNIEHLIEVFNNALKEEMWKRPEKVLKDADWKVCIEKYHRLYES